MNVVSELLRSSLLTALGDDADRLAHLQGAISTTAEALAAGERPRVPSTVLTAFDENTPGESSVMAGATDRLLAEWPLFPNAFPTAPVEVLRTIALAGLAEAAAREPRVMQGAWYTARTAVEVLTPGRWADTVAAVMGGWRGPVDAAIRAQWVPTSATASIRMPALTPIAKDATIGINTKVRERATEIAASGNWQTFSQELTPAFAGLVADLVSVSEILAAEAQRRAVGQVKEFATELGARLRETIGAQEQAVAAIELRSTLMWWKESRYSDRLGCRYDDLSGADLAIAAAHDLHLLVPEVAPVSVEHVLADLVAGLTTGGVTLGDLAAAAEVRALPSSSPATTPATLLGAARSGGATPVLGAGEITLPRAAVLLFRDLQAARLCVAPPPPPPPLDEDTA